MKKGNGKYEKINCFNFSRDDLGIVLNGIIRIGGHAKKNCQNQTDLVENRLGYREMV